MRSKAPFLATALFAILACVAGSAFAAEGQAPVAPAISPAAPAVSQPALQPTPLPLFLTDTYRCSYDVPDPCTGGVYTTCYIQCNVGQSCSCIATYGHDTTDCGVYVVRVSRPFCY